MKTLSAILLFIAICLGVDFSIAFVFAILGRPPEFVHTVIVSPLVEEAIRLIGILICFNVFDVKKQIAALSSAGVFVVFDVLTKAPWLLASESFEDLSFRVTSILYVCGLHLWLSLLMVSRTATQLQGVFILCLALHSLSNLFWFIASEKLSALHAAVVGAIGALTMLIFTIRFSLKPMKK